MLPMHSEAQTAQAMAIVLVHFPTDNNGFDDGHGSRSNRHIRQECGSSPLCRPASLGLNSGATIQLAHVWVSPLIKDWISEHEVSGALSISSILQSPAHLPLIISFRAC